MSPEFSLTVLTATYNRAALLPRLYESLLRQATDSLEWLVVDDGSTDDTAKVVERFIGEGHLRVRYVRKANGGKHTALNVGVSSITSLLTMIVDSDDYLTADAVDLIQAYHAKYRDRADLCGLSFLRVDPGGKPLIARSRLPGDEFVESYIDCRINRHLDGDMAEVFLTERLREFPFPEFPGESFISEDVVWIKMALRYNLAFVSRPIYVCEYLPGGLTRTGRAKSIRSPRGAMERAKMLMHEQCSLRSRIKGAVLYVCYGRFAGKGMTDILTDSGHPGLCLLAFPLGALLHVRWKRQFAGLS